MTEMQPIREAISLKIWITIRFIVLGIGGFLALRISWLSLIFAVTGPPSERWLSPFLAVPLSFIGALMMLYGVGQWRRWAYLWVFVSGPVVVSSLALLVSVYPALDFTFAMGFVIVEFGAPMVVSYLLVKAYYKRRDKQMSTQQL